MDIFLMLGNADRFEDLYTLSRYCYRVGEPIITDREYNILEEYIKDNNLSDLVNQSYDDDDVPVKLLKEFNLEHLIFDTSNTSKYIEYFSADRSMSIKALEDYREAFEFFNSIRGNNVVASLKLNGLFNQSLYLDGDYKATFTRGRKGNCIDVSKNASRVIKGNISGDNKRVTVYSESLALNYKSIPRVNGGGEFTSSRMAANSMLRVEVPSEYYKYLKTYAFNAEGLGYKTLSETLSHLKNDGFDVVPHKYIESSCIPEDYDTFCSWLKEILDFFYEESRKQGIDSDGVVIDVDDLDYVGSISNQYTSRNCALKFEYWSHKYYMGVIKDIHVEQKRVKASAVIEIEPIVTEDNVTARRVTTYNPSYIIDNNFNIGSVIYFERNSEAISVILTGDKLKSALNKSDGRSV